MTAPTTLLGDGGGRLFDWWTAGDERWGPDDRFRPPARSRQVVEEIFECGAIITGRRTFDIAGGWGGHHPVARAVLPLDPPPARHHVGPGTGGTVVTDGIERALEQARAVAGERTIAVGAATSPSSTSEPACSTRSISTWCPCSSATASASFPTSKAVRSSSRAPVWSNLTASPTSVIASCDRPRRVVSPYDPPTASSPNSGRVLSPDRRLLAGARWRNDPSPSSTSWP